MYVDFVSCNFTEFVASFNSFVYVCVFLYLCVCVIFRVFTEKIMSSASRDNFTSSFPFWMPFLSFSCPIALARTSSIMLNRSGKMGILVCYWPHKKTFYLSPFNMLAVEFLYAALMLKQCFFYSYWVENFSFIMKGCWILSKVFSTSFEMIMCDFLTPVVVIVITFHALYHPYLQK